MASLPKTNLIGYVNRPRKSFAPDYSHENSPTEPKTGKKRAPNGPKLKMKRSGFTSKTNVNSFS